MNKQSAKTELANLLTQPKGKEPGLHIAILSYNDRYKVENLSLDNKKRWAIHTISESKAKKLLSTNSEAFLIYFQVAEETDPEPAWMKEHKSLFIPIKLIQTELLENFFNCKFTIQNFKSSDEYYNWYNTSHERILWVGVKDIWEARVKALAAKIGGSH